MPERDELDRLIDSELARYAEPRTGLDQRILARVQAEGTSRPGVLSRWRRWAFAGVVAAIALVLAISFQWTADRKPNFNIAYSTGPDHLLASPTTTIPGNLVRKPQLQQTAKPTHNASHKSKSIQLAQAIQHPKLDVFPAPQPLSGEEESLVRLATYLPKKEREKLLSDPKSADAPLEISSIRISPITMPPLGKN